MLKKGITFLEVLVVISVMAIIAGMLVPTSQETVNLQKLSSEAKLVAQKLVQLSVDARVSGHVVQLVCSSSGMTANVYLGNQARDYSTAQARSSISANLIGTVSIESSSNTITLAGNCLTAKTFYITSEGYIFSAQGVAGITNIELRAGTLGANVDISGAGSTTVKVGVIGAINNEI